jgi:TrpR-related protein YerC/YecD
MSDNKVSVWNSKTTQQFTEALLTIDEISLLQNFLEDVMTENEIIEISSRLEAARMLQDGNKYTDIVAQTKLSSRTIARISECIKNGPNGYAAVLGKLNHRDHIKPVSAV